MYWFTHVLFAGVFSGYEKHLSSHSILLLGLAGVDMDICYVHIFRLSTDRPTTIECCFWMCQTLLVIMVWSSKTPQPCCHDVWICSGWICYACGKSKVLDTDLDTSLASACKTTENTSIVADPWQTVIRATREALDKRMRGTPEP